MHKTIGISDSQLLHTLKILSYGTAVCSVVYSHRTHQPKFGRARRAKERGQIKWNDFKKEKKKTNNIGKTIFLYCIAFFSFSISSEMIMHYIACWLFMSQTEWAYSIVRTQKGVFEWLILHFYSISFEFSTKKYTEFGTFYYVFFCYCMPLCLCCRKNECEWQRESKREREIECKALTLCLAHFQPLFSERKLLIVGQNQDMIYGCRFLFLSISVWCGNGCGFGFRDDEAKERA